MANSDEVQPAADNGNGGKADSHLAEISELCEGNAQLRSRNRKMALLGTLVIFVILALFTIRLIGIFTDYKKYFDGINHENWQAVIKDKDVPLSSYQVGKGPQIEAAVKEIVQDGQKRIIPAFERAQKNVTKEILPDFSDRVFKRLKARESEFSELSESMLNNLKSHAENQIKSELMTVLVDSANGVSEEIRKSFPELDDRQMEKELKDSQAYFFDKLHDLGTAKVAQFDPVIRGLKGRVDNMAKGKKVTPEMREQIANEFLEGLFDRMKYEFIPGLGEELADVPAKAAKKGGDR